MAGKGPQQLFDILLRVLNKEDDRTFIIDYTRVSPNAIAFHWRKDPTVEMVFVWNNEKNWMISTRKALKI